MTAFTAHMVLADVDLLSAAYHLDATVVRSDLNGLTTVAEDLGLPAFWANAGPFGLDFGLQRPGPVPGIVGVSLDYAAVIGTGFWSEIYGVKPLSGRHAAAIRRIVAAAGERFPFRIQAGCGLLATWVYDFDEAYRRRLAYCLAYAASISAGSLTPYQERLDPLITGSLEDLRHVTKRADTFTALSICFNLLTMLDGALANEELNKFPSRSELAGPIRMGVAKRAFLEERLAEGINFLGTSVNSDARIALRALYKEAMIARELRFTYRPILQMWGKIGGSDLYASSP